MVHSLTDQTNRQQLPSRSMMPSHQFRMMIVEPAASQFKREPTSLLHSLTVIWAIDAYASHVALERASAINAIDPSHLQKVEIAYKNSLMSSTRSGAWQFEVLHEISNAGKHGTRKKTNVGVKDSSMLSVETIEGWLWYFETSEPHPYWGDQVVVTLALLFDKAENVWINNEGKIFRGPFSRWVPVHGLIDPSITLIESGP